MISLKRTQKGLSLIELMIATGLSLILTLGVIQIFSSSKQTSRVQDSLARLQENARFALDLLAHDIRMAGQLSCDSSIKPTDNSGGLLRPFGNGIFGYEYADLPAVLINDHGSNPSNANIIEGTDAIVVMSASTNTIPTEKNTINVIVGEFSDIETGDPLLISDCETADIFIANKINNSSIGTTVNLNKSYRDDSQLAPLNYSAYYIRTFDNNNNDASDDYQNLYRAIVTSSTHINKEPLLEGVEDMQILYGEDINGDGSAIRYVDASTANMNKVTSVRIHLLLHTLEDGLASEPQDYWFNGTEHTATDKRLYRSFTTTIQLRNKI